ncbi:MAG: hypothetical protein ABEK12_03560, partial [Candidatus Nanohaloarchaea archaeon]
ADGKRMHELLDDLEPGETLKDAEPREIETAGREWRKETAEGWASAFFERGTEEWRQAKEKMMQELKGEEEDWEESTWAGIKAFIEGPHKKAMKD